MTCFSPAKINLYLKVAPRRQDGFHSLVSWFVTTGLHDVLTFDAAANPSITLSCCDPTLATDQSNLIVRAALALQQRSSLPRGARIHLEKRIPMGAGLGGGSSNAATTLAALNQLWELNLSLETLIALGASLGSDVPFFLHAPSAICRGRGEIVQPVPPPAGKWALLILPAIHMPTPQVYQRFDEMKLGSDLAQAPDAAALGRLPTVELMSQLFNDLEAPAFAISPELGELRQGIESLVSRPVRMSGSGSSLFTLFDSPSESAAAAEKVTTSLSVRTLSVELG